MRFLGEWVKCNSGETGGRTENPGGTRDHFHLNQPGKPGKLSAGPVPEGKWLTDQGVAPILPLGTGPGDGCRPCRDLSPLCPP